MGHVIVPELFQILPPLVHVCTGEVTLNMDKPLFSLTVSETDRNRNFWTTQLWITDITAAKARESDVLILPWDDFRDGHPTLFPQGTTGFIKAISGSTPLRLAIAVDQSSYREIALHAFEWRLPKLLCNTIIAPVLLNVLASYIFEELQSHPDTQIVQQELIVDDENGRCISIQYKGPADDLVNTFKQQISACFPASNPTSSTSGHSDDH